MKTARQRPCRRWHDVVQRCCQRSRLPTLGGRPQLGQHINGASITACLAKPPPCSNILEYYSLLMYIYQLLMTITHKGDIRTQVTSICRIKVTGEYKERQPARISLLYFALSLTYLCFLYLFHITKYSLHLPFKYYYVYILYI